MTYIIRKKSKETPLTGRVVNELDNPLQQENAPSLELMKKGLTKKDLVVNGDFQVWQRGEIIEFNSINTSYNMTKYHADMWFSYFSRTDSDVLKFEKIKNGVRCTLSRDTNISQYITDELDSTKDYTFVISVNDTEHILRFKGQETKSNEFMQHSSKKTTGSYNRLIIFVKNSDVVNWASLYEGDIAHPHVKEDYSIALLKCQRFIKAYSQSCPIKYEYGTSPTFYYLIKCSFEEMETQPTITNIYYQYIDISSVTNEGRNVTVAGIYKRSFVLKTEPLNRMHNSCKAVDIDFIVTCEPI